MFQPSRQFIRGEIYMGFMDPVFGRELGGYKYRPCVVVSIPDVHSTGIITIVPGTSTPQLEKSWNCILVESDSQNGLRNPTYFLCHQVRAVEQARLRNRIGSISRDDLARIRETLARCLAAI